MVYCRYCGTQNRDGNLKCSNCGKPLSLISNEPQSRPRFSKNNNQNFRENRFRNNPNQENSIKARYLEKNQHNPNNQYNQNNQGQKRQQANNDFQRNQNPQYNQSPQYYQNPQHNQNPKYQQSPQRHQNQGNYPKQRDYQNYPNYQNYQNRHNSGYEQDYLNQENYLNQDDYQNYGGNNEYYDNLHQDRFNQHYSQNYNREAKKVSKTAIEWDVVIATALMVIILTAIIQRIFPSFAIFISLLLGLSYILIATKSKPSLIKSIPLTIFVILAISAFFSL